MSKEKTPVGFVVVGWEYRYFDSNYSRWESWKRCEPRHPHMGETAENFKNEIQGYINAGFSYELRMVYAIDPASAEEKAIMITEGLLRSLIKEATKNDCEHEETHRGGTIWTICNSCGKKWADDQGGFVPFKEAKAVTEARRLLPKD